MGAAIKGSIEWLIGQDDLESARTEERAEDVRVAFVNEVAIDSDYFNEVAFENLVSHLAATGTQNVVLDGMVSRLDRPEYLCDKLTYWNQTIEEATHAQKRCPNREHYQYMAKVQLEMLDERLGQMREAMPDARIVMNINNDDVGFTASQIIHELLVSAGGAKADLRTIKGGITDLRDERMNCKQRQKDLKGVKGKPASDERYRIKGRLGTINDNLVAAAEEEAAWESEVALFTRPKRVRPIHQYTQELVVEDLIGQYKELGEKHGIEILTKDTKLKFNGFVVDYAHNRERGQTPLKERASKLVDGTHGEVEELMGIDAVVESGHHGEGFKALQRLVLEDDEINFQQYGVYAGVVGTKNITILAAAPFEDQAALRKYVEGSKPGRLALGKSIGSRNHHATKRLLDGGVSGLTILRKDADNMVHAEMAQFADFADGSILEQPDTYNLIMITSDEHIGAAVSIPVLRVGAREIYKLLSGDNPITIAGKPVKAVGFISGGDTAESNAGFWPDKLHDAEEPETVHSRNLERLAAYGALPPVAQRDSLSGVAMEFTSEANSGSTQSMRAILDQVASYYSGMHDVTTASGSRLRDQHVSVHGNHTDAVLRKLGMKESDTFVAIMKERGHDVFEVGVRHSDKDAQIKIGGGDYAHVIFVPDYGVAADGGEAVFGPVRLLVQHDPVSGRKGHKGAGKTTNADLAISGHTHEHYVEMVNAGDNKVRFAYRAATTNGVDPTQVRYASGVPRTQGAHAVTMPKKGQLVEMTFPGHVLKAAGEAYSQREARAVHNKVRAAK